MHNYNTEREQLILPEYGRCVQNMVNYAKTLPTKEERQHCASTIIALMSGLHDPGVGSQDDKRQKLWNHLAAIADYDLDIDYPVEIQRMDETKSKRERVPYPQKHIAKRHYGHLVESMIQKIMNVDDDDRKQALINMVATQMKRDLASWNVNAMSDVKILDDLAEYTKGRLSLRPSEVDIISDANLLAELQSQPAAGGGKKKKKK